MKFIVENRRYIWVVLVMLLICTGCFYDVGDGLNTEITFSKEDIINGILANDGSLDSDFVR